MEDTQPTGVVAFFLLNAISSSTTPSVRPHFLILMERDTNDVCGHHQNSGHVATDCETRKKQKKYVPHLHAGMKTRNFTNTDVSGT